MPPRGHLSPPFRHTEMSIVQGPADQGSTEPGQAQDGGQDTVERSLRAAVAAEPDRAGGRIDLATYLVSIGRLGEAVDQLRGAVHGEPASPAGWAALALIQSSAGNAEAVEPMVRRALVLEPAHVQAAYIRYRSGTSLPGAETRRLRHLLVTGAGQAPAVQAMVANLLDRGLADLAQALLRRLSIAAPGVAGPLLVQANQADREERWTDSARLLRWSTVLHPRERQLALQCAQRLFRTEQYEAAHRCCLEAIRANTTDAELWFLLGRVLGASGRYGPGEKALRHAVDLDPRLAPGKSILDLRLVPEDFAIADPANARTH